MFILILIFLILIQIQFGLLVSIQITIWLLVYFLSNLLLGFNPWSKQLLVIRLMSIFVIIFILYYNCKYISISTMIILPLSIDKISYFHEFNQKTIVDSNDCREYVIYLMKDNNLSDWFLTFNKDENYVVTLEFIPDIPTHLITDPQLLISKPFLVNHHSSITTIDKFISERLNVTIDYYGLDDFIFTEYIDGITPIILIRYTRIQI